MSFHTKRSPSQAKRFSVCFGSLAYCSTLNPEHINQSGEAARVGTATHGLIEHCLGADVAPESMRDRIIELVGTEENAKILPPRAKLPKKPRVFYIVDDDMIAGAELMCDHVNKRLADLGVDRSALQLESRTNPLPERDDTSGTADVTIDAWPILLEVEDYKNGYLTVEHEDNDQLLAYLTGKAEDTGWSHEGYAITVVQPNGDHELGPIRTFKATPDELRAFQARYRAVIAKNEEAEAAFEKLGSEPLQHKGFGAWAKQYLSAGEDAEACTFCDAKTVCPVRLAFSQQRAIKDFDMDDEPAPITFDPRNETVGRILAWAPHVEELIKAAELYGLRSSLNGHKIPNTKLVRRTTHTKWDELPEPELAAEIVKGKYIPAKDLYKPPVLITAPQAIKLVPPKRRDEFKAKFTVKPEGELCLVNIKDKRKAVPVNPGDDFDDDLSPADDMDFG